MSTLNLCFYRKLTKIIILVFTKYPLPLTDVMCVLILEFVTTCISTYRYMYIYFTHIVLVQVNVANMYA